MLHIILIFQWNVEMITVTILMLFAQWPEMKRRTFAILLVCATGTMKATQEQTGSRWGTRRASQNYKFPKLLHTVQYEPGAGQSRVTGRGGGVGGHNELLPKQANRMRWRVIISQVYNVSTGPVMIDSNWPCCHWTDMIVIDSLSPQAP